MLSIRTSTLFPDERPDYIFVFGADHIYRMDPRQMLDQHIASGAGVTVAALRMARSDASAFGVIDRGEGTQLAQFLEKPADPPGLQDSPDESLVSMGNYVFDADTLVAALEADANDPDSRHDIGGDLIPRLVKENRAHVYDYSTNRVPGDTELQRGYWRDVGTLDAYFDANMDLVQPLPRFSLYNDSWPIFTHWRALPPAKFVRDGERNPSVVNTIVSNGAILSGCDVFEGILAPGVRVGRDATLEGAVLLDDVNIGEGAIVKRAVIDKNVVVPAKCRIGVDEEEDRARGLMISDGGVVTVPKNYRFA